MDNELNQLISDFKEAEMYDNTPKLIEIANKILKLNPDLIKYKEELAQLHFYNQDYDKCIEYYNDFIKDYKETDWSNYYIAFSYLYKDDIDKAFHYLDKVKDEEMHLKFKRMAYQELEDYENAIEYGDRLLEMNPEDQATLTAMSNVYSAIGDDERSSFYFDELCKLEPNLSSFKLITLYEKEMFYQFIESFEELKSKNLLEGELKDAFFNSMAGISYYYANMPEESISYLLKSEELSPDPNNISLIAKNYMELNDYINAYRYLKKGLKDDETNEDILFLLSEVCLIINENYKSIDYANRLLNLTDNYDRIFYVLALDYFDWDEKETGLKCFKMGAEGTDIDDEYFLDILDRISKNHQSDRVLKHWKILEEEFPAYPKIYLHRAMHYKRMGDYDLAHRDVDKYNSLVDDANLEFDEL